VALKLVEEATRYAAPTVGRVNVNQVHETGVKKSIIHDAVAKKNPVVFRAWTGPGHTDRWLESARYPY
jgi:hypothetical protein